MKDNLRFQLGRYLGHLQIEIDQLETILVKSIFPTLTFTKKSLKVLLDEKKRTFTAIVEILERSKSNEL